MQKKLLIVFLLCFFCAFPLAQNAFSGDFPKDYVEAKARLAKMENSGAHPAEWSALAEDFRKIYSANQSWGLRHAALYRSALAHEKRASVTRSPNDAKNALNTYEEVIKKHPKSALADDALYRSAVICAEILKDKNSASTHLLRIIQKYPKSDHASPAMAYADKLNGEARQPEKGKAQPEKKQAAANAKNHSPKAAAKKTQPSADRQEALRKEAVPAQKDKDKQKDIAGDVRKQVPNASAKGQAPAAGKDQDASTGKGQSSAKQEDTRKNAASAHEGKGAQKDREGDARKQVPNASAKGQEPAAGKDQDASAGKSQSSAKQEDPRKNKASAQEDNGAQKNREGDARKQVPNASAKGQEPAADKEKSPAAADASVKKGKPSAQGNARQQKKDKSGNTPKKKSEQHPPHAKMSDPRSALAAQLGLTVRTVVLDPGHGGKDPGTSHHGVVEKNVNLNVALKLKAILEKQGFVVKMTRSSNKLIPLGERVRFGRKAKGDLFVSIHVNACDDPRIHGMETYILDFARTSAASRLAIVENADSGRLGDMDRILTEIIRGARTSESLRLAEAIQRETVRRLKARGIPLHSGGVKGAPFFVLVGSRMPSVLVEVGYCTNAEEARRLNSDSHCQNLAEGIAAGIWAYAQNLGVKKR